MILTTGGRAVGATSTRSSPRSSAAASASSIGSTPSCSPVLVMTRTGLMRIIRLTRTRRSRSFVDSASLLGEKENGHPGSPGCPATEARGARSAVDELPDQDPDAPPALLAGWGWEAFGLRFNEAVKLAW